MLDVYRTYYQLTGEPFRLGPDHRFSLHHASYANAKAYLDFAIYQGEGFIAITGGPGTGKTTLISEILAGLNRDKIEVATLTSTQLESRDLLQMVASSFGLHPEKINKAELLLEIESFLLHRIREGHRAILIVDEAQGLSPSALEELRQLANLQYQYQLLLQIFLVGQERLLELIRSPGMEHLQQRLVAATSLDPLSFDETIDYIEHRLSRVGWEGDPAIEEPALRLVYCYSAGIPRRINLITNRLFLYGAMQEKHCFSGEDARTVIDDLIAEFLLPSEPVIAEANVKAALADTGGETRVRSLPRNTGGSGPVAAAVASKQAAGSGGTAPSDDEPTERMGARPQPEKRRQPPPPNFKLDRESMPGSHPQSRVARGTGQRRAGAPSRRDKARHPSSAHPVREPVRKDNRAATEPVWDDDEDSGGKGLFIFALLLAGAGAAYFLYNKSIDLDKIYKLVSDTTAVVRQLPHAPDVAGEHRARTEVAPAPLAGGPGSAAQDLEATPDSQEDVVVGELGPIIRAQQGAPADAADTTNDAVPGTDTAGAAGEAELPPEAPVAASGTETVEQQAPQVAPASPGITDNPVGTGGGLAVPAVEENDAIVAHAPAEPQESAVPAVASEPAVRAQEHPASPVAASAKQPEAEAVPEHAAPRQAEAHPASPAAVASASNTISERATPPIDAERARLEQAAERRFSAQVARIKSDGVSAPVATPPAATIDATPSPEVTVSRAEPPDETPPKRSPRITPAGIKNTLLQGRWSSSGKPATLLPSESTYCDNRGDRIWCVSVPQNVKTQYGLALYKVETTLTGFSAQGHFEMSYRTLVKLVGAGTSGANQGPDAAANGGWQATEYSMSCTLTDPDQVACLDGKGITRRYLRIASGKT